MLDESEILWVVCTGCLLLVLWLIQIINFLVSDQLVAESFEKLMENKVVKEKRLELEKKLETLKKKHEKVNRVWLTIK